MDLLLRAKEYTQLEETDPKYNSYFYLALRYLECPVTEAVNILRKQGRDVGIEYSHIFTPDPKTVLGIFTHKAKQKEEKIVKFLVEKGVPIDTVESHIAIMETILGNPKNPPEFLRILARVIGQMRLCHSKVTGTNIEEYLNG